MILKILINKNKENYDFAKKMVLNNIILNHQIRKNRLELFFEIFNIDQLTNELINNEIKYETDFIKENIEEIKNSLINNENLYKKINNIDEKIWDESGSIIKRKSYKNQETIIRKMIKEKNGMNFSEPGSGKTQMSLHKYLYEKIKLKNEKNENLKLIIIGPVSSKGVWRNEILEIIPDSKKEEIYISGEKNRKNIYDSTYIVVNYNSMHKLLENLFHLKNNYYSIVIDEVHNLKNKDGIFREVMNEVINHTNVWTIDLLTGTPLPKSICDLWSIWLLCWPHMDKIVNKEEFISLINASSDAIIKNELVSEIIKKSCHLSKTKQLGIPEEEIIKIKIKPTLLQIKEDKKLSKQLSRIISSLNKETKKQESSLSNIYDKMIINSSNCSALEEAKRKEVNYNEIEISEEYINDVKKDDRFIKLLELISKLISKEEKVVIWAYHTINIDTISFLLKEKDIKHFILDGKNNNLEKRETIISQLNNNEDNVKVLIANPRSVAESISLHKGVHNSIFFERDFNGINYLQAKDRIHRAGLPENTIVKHYVFINDELEIDQKIDENISNKDELQRIVLDKINKNIFEKS